MAIPMGVIVLPRRGRAVVVVAALSLVRPAAVRDRGQEEEKKSGD